MGQVAPWLFLLDSDGRWITPKLPTDQCGFFLDSFDGGPSAWQTLVYTDRVVCVVHNGDDSPWACR